MKKDNWGGKSGNMIFDNPGSCRVIADKEIATFDKNNNIGGEPEIGVEDFRLTRKINQEKLEK